MVTGAGVGLVALVVCAGSAARVGSTGSGAAGPALAVTVSAPAGARSAAAAYWTPARMARARPVALLRKPGNPPGSRRANASLRPHGYPFPYSRYRWSGPTTDLPARTWGKIFFSTPDGDYVCSGTAVSSENESVVWTAGHCAAGGATRRFYNRHWIFVPGYDNGKAPFGRFVGRRFFTTRAWFRDGQSAFDLAAVVVAPREGRTLVGTVGGQGIAFNQTRTQDYVSGGYPADYPFDGSSLYVCDAPLGNNDRASHPPTIAIGCDMTGGSSGGGWLVNVRNGLGTVVSVNSYGYLGQPDAMYGPYQGNAAERLYERASTSR